jgi:hypothetical protein
VDEASQPAADAQAETKPDHASPAPGDAIAADSDPELAPAAPDTALAVMEPAGADPSTALEASGGGGGAVGRGDNAGGWKSEETLTQHTFETMFGAKPDHEQIRNVQVSPEVVLPGSPVKLTLDIRWQTWGPGCITQYCVGCRHGKTPDGSPVQKHCLYNGTTSSTPSWKSRSATFKTEGLPDGKYDILFSQQMQYTQANAFAHFKGGAVIAQFVVGAPRPSKPSKSAAKTMVAGGGAEEEDVTQKRIRLALAALNLPAMKSGRSGDPLFPINRLGALLSSPSFGLTLHSCAVATYEQRLSEEADEDGNVSGAQLLVQVQHICSSFEDALTHVDELRLMTGSGAAHGEDELSSSDEVLSGK